jgi:hypothetical protein
MDLKQQWGTPPTSENGGYDVHSLRSLFVETYGNATQSDREKAFETVEKFGLILHHDIENILSQGPSKSARSRLPVHASLSTTRLHSLMVAMGSSIATSLALLR